MATLNVILFKELAEFVEAQVASGAYASASEVVRDGLRLLRREQAAHDEKIAILRREIGIGVEQAQQAGFRRSRSPTSAPQSMPRSGELSADGRYCGHSAETTHRCTHNQPGGRAAKVLFSVWRRFTSLLLA